jgi:hypothetical protein
MSQLVKTKHQANFKDFKRFEAFKRLIEQKNVVFNSLVCKLGSLWHSWASFHLRELNLHTNSLNKLVQPGYENWNHFSTFAQKMEPQKKNRIAGNIVFLRNYAFKKCS